MATATKTTSIQKYDHPAYHRTTVVPKVLSDGSKVFDVVLTDGERSVVFGAASEQDARHLADTLDTYDWAID